MGGRSVTLSPEPGSPEPVSELPAGRELDALVAEHVFGTAILTREAMEAEAVRVWVEQPQCTKFFWGFTAWRGDDGTIQCAQDFEPYSTDIAAAWDVVEKLGRDGFTCDIQWKGAGRNYEFTAEASFDKWTPPQSGHAVGSAPLAICRAALKTVRGEVL